MTVETICATNTHDLRAGDVLSYSAGSTQSSPEGYRKVGGRNNLLESVVRRWPELTGVMGLRPPLFINAYPASIGSFPQGITVDTYLSPRVLTRALQLGRAANHPTVLLGQPLFIADALLKYVQKGKPLPEVLMLWVGGYAMPQSLEYMLRDLLADHVAHLSIVQFFGAAEVDAGCLMARERNERGELIYHPREDVLVHVEDGDLLLSLKDKNGGVTDPFLTGDQAWRSGSGLVIRNRKRLHPLVEEALESWTGEEWRRRTGYVHRDGTRIWSQLREGAFSKNPFELDHFTFANRFGFSWLNKPMWR